MKFRVAACILLICSFCSINLLFAADLSPWDERVEYVKDKQNYRNNNILVFISKGLELCEFDKYPCRIYDMSTETKRNNIYDKFERLNLHGYSNIKTSYGILVKDFLKEYNKEMLKDLLPLKIKETISLVKEKVNSGWYKYEYNGVEKDLKPYYFWPGEGVLSVNIKYGKGKHNFKRYYYLLPLDVAEKIHNILKKYGQQ